MDEKKREEIALALALRDGHQPEDLADWRKTIYAKQADEPIGQEVEPIGQEVGSWADYFKALVAMCPKCGGRGYTEQEHGLFRTFCDCEKGEALRAEVTGEPESLSDTAAEANAFANALMPKLEGEDIYNREVLNDSDSGIEPDNQPVGSGDTGKPKQPRKPKVKKAARKRAK